MAPDEPRRKAALPGLETEPDRVAGDVGPVLVDDRHHAERHADPADREAVRTGRPLDDLADGVGQAGHLTQAGGHGLDAGRASSRSRSIDRRA